MMREMIEQDFDHPSIFAWSVCNESATSTPGGRAYVKAMADFVRSLDPDRFVSYADDGLPAVRNALENANQYTDFLMMNEYFGSWAGPAQELSPALDRIGRLFPTKPLIVSEFGLAAPFAPDAAQGDALRVRIMREQLGEFARRDWIAGAIFWCYQSYKSHRNLWPGETAGYVDMGLVDENRQRRPSYDAWIEATRPLHVDVAWTGPRWRPVTGFEVTVRRRTPEELPSYELSGYQAEWRVQDEGGVIVAQGEQALPTIGAPVTFAGSWPGPASRSYALHLRVLRPTGAAAYDTVERWWDPRFGGKALGPTR
jgi:beta-glucuronidase